MSELNRTTKETDISCTINIQGSGISDINTGVGFFNHMLEAFSKHSTIDLKITCKGDIEVDDHHSVEDCGIVIGELLKQEIFPIQNVERYGNATVVMDEARVSCSLDLSNRPYLVYDVNLDSKVGNFDTELVEEFFYALVQKAGITCHIVQEAGKNKHHIIEATFKAFAVALRRALVINEKLGIPSTKGVL